jgi:ureidoglycolate lyase
MSDLTLRAVPITPERFAPYGDLIYASSDSRNVMNDARFERFSDLADIDVDTKSGVAPSISIARCKAPMTLPYRFDLVERHPLGSQAFMPLSRFSFFVVVAPPGESVEREDLCAFVTNGNQGVNYHKGVWHMPMIALEEGQEFLIVDRRGDGENCEEHYFSDPVVLLAE